MTIWSGWNQRKVSVNMRDKRVKNPLFHNIERGMTKDALRSARRSDEEVAISWNKCMLGHAGHPPYGPAEKLVRKFAIRKAIRAKIKSEVSNAKETD